MINMEKLLVKYNQDLYYGVLSGLFITTEKELERLKVDDCEFGDVLGKHSDVVVNTFDYCEIMSYDQDLIHDLETVFTGGMISGYNPINYLPEYNENGERI